MIKINSNYPDDIRRLQKELDECDAVVIGAGAGLSTSAGYIYTGERFNRYFSDFAEKYGFQDMYSGGFIHIRQKGNSGHSGAGISGSTDTAVFQSLSMRNCWNWSKKRIIL